MRGRKPLPTHLHEVRNNPGKRARNRDEPDLPSVCPDPPDYLSKAAKERWAVVAPELEQAGILTQIDSSSLAGYCTVWVRWQRAEAAIDTVGDLVQTPQGYTQQSPYIGIANQLLKHVRGYEAEFGMTPSSRSRVKSHPRAPKTKSKSFEDRVPKLRPVG